jgi:pilus assembly protein CpaF
MRISEIVGVQDGDYQIEDIFAFEQTGVDANAAAVGRFYATGYRPRCIDRLRASGIDLPDGLFRQRRLSLVGTAADGSDESMPHQVDETP